MITVVPIILLGIIFFLVWLLRGGRERSSWHENHRHLSTTPATNTQLLEECLYLITAFESGCDYDLYYNETGHAIESLKQKLGRYEKIKPSKNRK